MNIRFGNMTVEQFARVVGADFAPDELAVLNSHRTDTANFTDPDKFHIFDDPAITISIGSKAMIATRPIWVGANTRKKFNREVSFYPITEAN